MENRNASNEEGRIIVKVAKLLGRKKKGIEL